LLFVGLFMLGCTNQTPATAPIINYTYTDNSQTIIGDNNKPVSKPDTSVDNATTATATADNTVKKSNIWIFYTIVLIIILVLIYIYRNRILKLIKRI
jgi:t-SNARE complex subunit (syntaxin)